MTTPVFIPQDGSSLAEIRYYTAQDPYYYSVDNRPLTDLEANILSVGSGSGDSGRRAVLLNQLAVAQAWSELFKGVSPSTSMASGLGISLTSAGVISIGQGAVYESEPVNSGLATPIIKQALLLTPVNLNVPAPSLTGQSVNYLVQFKINDLNATNMATSALPYIDATNTFLPCLLLNKELVVSVVTGVSATTGSQVTPSPTTGNSPLYVVTSTNGVASPSVTIASSAPAFRGSDQQLVPLVPSSGGPVNTTVLGTPTLTFQKSATETISIPVDLTKLNPYTPVSFKLLFSSDTAGGNFGIQASYAFVGVGGSTSGSLSITAVETMPLGVAANSLNTYQTTVATIPNSVFAAFNSGAWTTNSGYLAVTFQRIPTASNDTNSGNLYLHKIYASQNTY